MNRLKIAVLIIVISVALSGISLVFIQTACGTLIENLDEVILNINQKDKTSTLKNLDYAIEYFEKIKPFLNIIEGQNETIEIRSNLNKAIFFLNIKNYESSILYLEECKTDLNRIIVSSTPSLSTIL